VYYPELVQDYCRVEVLIFRAMFSLVVLMDLGFLVSLGKASFMSVISVHIYHKNTGIIFQRG